MRNRIIILFLFVGLSLPIAAQMHSAVEISVGGGWSTLGYKVQPKQEDVKAKFENGVLKLEIPKKEPQKQLPESKYIAIA